MKTVIILNGPPGSGKDTIANIFRDKYGATKQEFKDSLYEETAKYFEADLNYFRYVASSRKYKDNLISAFSCSKNSKGKGYTPREALIHVSEVICKPKYGADYFGVLAANKLADGLNIFSDGGGWAEELMPVAKAVNKVIICRLIRDGFTFEGDSRNYYEDSITDVSNIEVHDFVLSEGLPEDTINEIVKLL